MEGSERDSDTTLGGWVSVQDDNVISLGGSSSADAADDDASSNDNGGPGGPARDVVMPVRAADDDAAAAAAAAAGDPAAAITQDAGNVNDGDGDGDGDDGGSTSGFAIPAARPLVVEYYEAEMPPAASAGGAGGHGTQRRRKGHHHHHQQQQQQGHPRDDTASGIDANRSQQPTQPSRIRRRGSSAPSSSILRNPMYLFGTLTVVAYLLRPNSSQISMMDAGAAAPFRTALDDDPWDQGADFRDRTSVPEEWKRKRTRTEKAAAAKRKKMEEAAAAAEEEEEAARKNATIHSEDEDEEDEDGVEVSVDEGEGKEVGNVEEETRSANATLRDAKTKVNITNFTTTLEAAVDPFPQLYDWQNWTTRLANETTADSVEDPIFLWFAPQSGGGAFVKMLEDCYEGINITRSQWWQNETPDDDNITDSDAGANSWWWWQHDTAPLQDTSRANDGRLPIMATTSLVEAAASAFNSSAGRGRCISLFMHPIERAIRSYHHHRMISSRVAKRTAVAMRNSTSNITLESYAQGPFAEENRLVRSITDRNSSEILQWNDLDVSMDFVTRKCLVGVIGDKRSLLIRTVALIEMALGLTKREGNSARCTADRIDEWADSMHEISTQRIALPSEDTGAWGALMRKNAYDMKLYERVTELFANQTTLLNETNHLSSTVKSTALNNRAGKVTILATENRSKPANVSADARDKHASEGDMAIALDESPIDKNLGRSELDGDENEIEEEEDIVDEEVKVDDDEAAKDGKGKEDTDDED